MGQITLTINNRNYAISCDDGQEQRVVDLGHYVDQRLKEIARAGAANSESHLLVLTTLMLADEIFELRNNINTLDRERQQSESYKQDEEAIAEAIEQLASRIDTIADRIQSA